MREALFLNEPELTRYKKEWMDAGQISENQMLTPFTAKALYAFGMMRHLMESAGWALKHNPPYQAFYISAYLLSCGAIELLGRCVSGDDDEAGGATRRLKCGLKQIASLARDNDDDQVIVKTSHKPYTVRDCVALRNFCAHGASVGKFNIEFDVELADEILKKLAGAMDDHWNRLMSSPDGEPRKNLAKAAITPLFAGDSAILVGDVYDHIKKRGAAIGAGLMYREAWQTYK